MIQGLYYISAFTNEIFSFVYFVIFSYGIYFST